MICVDLHIPQLKVYRFAAKNLKATRAYQKLRPNDALQKESFSLISPGRGVAWPSAPALADRHLLRPRRKAMSSSSTANPPAKHPGQLLRQRLLRCRGGVDGREREGRNRKNRTCQAVLHRAPPHVAEPDVGDHLLQQLRRSKAIGNGHGQIRRSSSLSTSIPVRRTFGRLSTGCCPCA